MSPHRPKRLLSTTMSPSSPQRPGTSKRDNLTSSFPSSICTDLLHRELGLLLSDGHGRHRRPLRTARNLVRQSHRILRKVVCAPDTRRFVSVGSKPIVGKHVYADGKLIARNNVTKEYDCLVRDNSEISEVKLYSLPSHPLWKDQDVWVGPLPGGMSPSLEHKAQMPSLIVLKEDGCLYRYDLSTGAELQRVFLSSEMKFDKMVCEEESSMIMLKSVRSKAKNVLLNLIIMQYPPLEFRARFEVTRSVFGSKVVDAEILRGFLIMMLHDRTIRAYRLDDILDKFTVKNVALGDLINGNPEFVVGETVELPLNLKIGQLPDCIFETKSYPDLLQICSSSWKYITSEYINEFKVRDLATDRVLRNGNIEGTDGVEPDHVIFHTDSTRIVHTAPSKLRILDILPGENGSAGELREVFSLPPSSSSSSQTQNPIKSSTTSYGRTIKANRYTMSAPKKKIAFDYEDELDLMLTLTYSELEDEDSNVTTSWLEKVTIYDNSTFEVLREISLWKEVKEGAIHLSLDRDVLLVHINGEVARSLMFRLVGPQEDEDEEESEGIPARSICPKFLRRSQLFSEEVAPRNIRLRNRNQN